MTAPCGVMTLLDTELRAILAALDASVPENYGPDWEIHRRARKKVAQELALKERPFLEKKKGVENVEVEVKAV